jgi:hypothetical protein
MDSFKYCMSAEQQGRYFRLCVYTFVPYNRYINFIKSSKTSQLTGPDKFIPRMDKHEDGKRCVDICMSHRPANTGNTLKI